MQKVTKTNDCWLWNGSVDNGGYGRLGINNTVKMAHRAVYELLVGEIPEGLEIDHLCKVRNCVNPAHLEPVSRKENCLRSDSPWAENARKTSCKYGHPFDEENTYQISPTRRSCKKCVINRINAKKDYYNERKREARRKKRELSNVHA